MAADTTGMLFVLSRCGTPGKEEEFERWYQTVHIPDVLLDPEYTWHEGRKLGGWRAMLGIPLLREGRCIGVMAITRLTARPFTDRYRSA